MGSFSNMDVRVHGWWKPHALNKSFEAARARVGIGHRMTRFVETIRGCRLPCTALAILVPILTLLSQQHKMTPVLSPTTTVPSTNTVSTMTHRGPIFIVGSGHSGTTLMCALLDSHPDACCGPESEVYFRNPNATLSAPLATSAAYVRHVDALGSHLGERRAEAIDSVVRRYCVARKPHATRWAEKTPVHVQYLDAILDDFPLARVVVLVRNGLDSVCSFARRGNAPGPDRQAAPALDGAERWIGDNLAIQPFLNDERVHLVHLEELVAHPAKVLRRVFAHSGLDRSRDAVAAALYRGNTSTWDAAPAEASVWHRRRGMSRHERKRLWQRRAAISPSILQSSAWRGCLSDGNVSLELGTLLECGLPAVRVTGRKTGGLTRHLLATTRMFHRLMGDYQYHPRRANSTCVPSRVTSRASE